MKYTGDYKENSIVIIFSILILIWLYKSNKNIKTQKKDIPKWILIFDKYKIILYLITLGFYILNSFDVNLLNIKLSDNKKYKMKVYTEPPKFI